MLLQRHRISRLLLLSCLMALAASQQVQAHGSMEIPLSRVYNCFQEGPENPRSAACRAAVQVGGTQALYDWNGVNRLDANGRHQAIIPDGKLCSAGKESHKGLDLARTDWPAQTLAPTSSGTFDFIFRATAPHATRYFQLYITRDGYNPSQPLRWADLEATPFCTITSVTLVNGRYQLHCPLPRNKVGKHVIYSIWQRSDSPEAFYTCMDVQFGTTTPPPPTSWREVGRLRAQQDLLVGSVVTFRLFDSTGGDIESHSVTLQQGMQAASDWPLALAQVVNAASSFVNIGVLGTNGIITPIRSAQGNSVYVRSTATHSFEIDIDPPTDPPDGTVDFNYPDGRGGYTAGTTVRGTDGNIYECRPFPNSGWCNGWELYYAPGTGLAWQDAWIRLP